MNRLSLKHKLIYSMGNLGIAIITVMHTSFLVYFFFPPKDAGIPYLIPTDNIVFGLTLLGIIMAMSRIVDVFFDPIIAHVSDRLKHPKGRRIPIMRWTAIPFATCYLLVFFVPVSDDVSYLNVGWLTVFMLLSAAFFAAYMIPFYSLMVEIAKTSEDKIDLGTISSAFWFVGFLLVSFTPTLWPLLTEYLQVSKLQGVRLSFLIMGLLGLICLLAPALLIDERQFFDERVQRSHQPLLRSLQKVLQNRSFFYYLVTNTCYNVATSIFESGLIYFITVLAIMEASVQGPLTTVIGVLVLACYPLINKLAKTQGKSWVLRVCLVLFAITFCVICLFGIGGLPPYVLFALIILLSPFAQAGFGILPQVIAADCAAYDQYKSGEDHAGMYIAANGFSRKLGTTLGVLLFTSFLLFGKDIGDDMGIRYATLFGSLISIVGLLFMFCYDEKEILTYTRELDNTNDKNVSYSSGSQQTSG